MVPWLALRPDRGAVSLWPLKELRLRSGFSTVALPSQEELQPSVVGLLVLVATTALSKVTTLHSGSLGSGVDEERSKLRVGM